MKNTIKLLAITGLFFTSYSFGANSWSTACTPNDLRVYIGDASHISVGLFDCANDDKGINLSVPGGMALWNMVLDAHYNETTIQVYRNTSESATGYYYDGSSWQSVTYYNIWGIQD